MPSDNLVFPYGVDPFEQIRNYSDIPPGGDKNEAIGKSIYPNRIANLLSLVQGYQRTAAASATGLDVGCALRVSSWSVGDMVVEAAGTNSPHGGYRNFGDINSKSVYSLLNSPYPLLFRNSVPWRVMRNDMALPTPTNDPRDPNNRVFTVASLYAKDDTFDMTTHVTGSVYLNCQTDLVSWDANSNSYLTRGWMFCADQNMWARILEHRDALAVSVMILFLGGRSWLI